MKNNVLNTLFTTPSTRDAAFVESEEDGEENLESEGARGEKGSEFRSSVSCRKRRAIGPSGHPAGVLVLRFVRREAAHGAESLSAETQQRHGPGHDALNLLMLAAERYEAMEDMQELQRPLLGEQVKGKPFSHPLLHRSQEEPTPPLERAWNQLTLSKYPSRMDAWSRKDTADALCRPSLAFQVESTVLLSLKGCGEITFPECRNEEDETGNTAWPLDLELESKLDKVPTISIDVEDVPFLEMQADHYSDDDSDTDSEGTFSLGIPQDHLGLALFSMLCCFWPVGIAAFCLSQKTSKVMDRGDYHEARSASKQAFCMAVCSIALGACTYIAGVVVLALYMSRNAHA